MLTIREAAEQLGVIPECFSLSRKYQPFIHRTEGKRDGRFDMEGYMKVQDDMYELIQKTQLFIQYLVHEESMAYTKIASMVGIRHQSVQQNDFGIGIAIKIARYFNDYRPFYVRRFNEYYGFKQVTYNRPIWKRKVKNDNQDKRRNLQNTVQKDET